MSKLTRLSLLMGFVLPALSGCGSDSDPVFVDRVEVEPASVMVAVGESVQLRARAYDESGTELSGRQVSWSSDDSTIAAVDTSGLVTGVSSGAQNQPVQAEVLVTATVEGMSGFSAIRVRLEPAVNTTDDSDDGTCDATHCSLREALVATNWGHSNGTIRFNIPGTGPHTIQPLSPLPNLVQTPATIDGYSQPGAAQNTAPPDSSTNAVLMIEVDGSLSPGAITLGDGSVVQGLVLNRGAYLSISGSRNTIQGNFIGTDVTGAVAQGSPVGIQLTGSAGSGGNVIGGTEPSARNLVSGNTVGIRISDAEGTIVQGNLIGTDASGTSDSRQWHRDRDRGRRTRRLAAASWEPAT